LDETYLKSYTIFLFTPASLVPLIDTLYCANGQNDGYYKKKNSSNDSCSDGFVFDLALDDVRDLFAGGLTCQRM
jgi:hypothetical protein